MKRLLTVLLVIAASISCNDNLQTSKTTKKAVTLDGEKVFTGICTAFGTETKEVSIYYVEDEDVYYPAYYYSGEGSFDFKWDKATNKVSIQACYTDLYSGLYPICTLSQEDYERIMGAEAEASYYDPTTKTFTFNILYETADDSGNRLQFTDTVKYVVDQATE